MQRRSVLKAGLVLVASATAAAIYRPVGAATAAAMRVLAGGTRWLAKETLPPAPVDARVRAYLTDAEMAQVKAIFDRLIPADALGMSASDAGCVVFLDHQLAGPYGKASWRYLGGPVHAGTPTQGEQSVLTPAQLYRKGLPELDAYCTRVYGKAFATLSAPQQDGVLEKMEAGQVQLATVHADLFFKQLLGNVQEGYFADPIYGGNRDMVGWKMIGFPGARYDYRDYVRKKGQKLDIIPISIAGRI